MKHSNLQISVAMATYNGARYIREQLDSILRQTIIPDEIIISDDGSTDDTLGIITDYISKYPSITLLHNTEYHGAEGNFMNAFKHCHGDIIFPTDQDDIWVANKIEKMLAAFTDDIEIVYAQDEIFDEKRVIGKTNWCIPALHKAMWKNSLAGHACAFRKSILCKYTPTRKLSWDYEICLYGSVAGSSKEINEILVYWRRHSGTLTSSDSISYEELPTNKYARLRYAIKQTKRGEYSVPFYDYMTERKRFVHSIGGGNLLIVSMLRHQKWWSFLLSGIMYVFIEMLKNKPKSIRDVLGHAAWAFCYPAVFWCEMRKQKWIT